MRMLLTTALAASCAACATPSAGDDGMPVRDPAGECDANADDIASLVRERATPEIGARLLRMTGAETLRWVPPRTAVTMDFRPDRLTVSYNDDMVIERISCG